MKTAAILTVASLMGAQAFVAPAPKFGRTRYVHQPPPTHPHPAPGSVSMPPPISTHPAFPFPPPPFTVASPA